MGHLLFYSSFPNFHPKQGKKGCQVKYRIKSVILLILLNHNAEDGLCPTLPMPWGFSLFSTKATVSIFSTRHPLSASNWPPFKGLFQQWGFPNSKRYLLFQHIWWPRTEALAIFCTRNRAITLSVLSTYRGVRAPVKHRENSGGVCLNVVNKIVVLGRNKLPNMLGPWRNPRILRALIIIAWWDFIRHFPCGKLF